MKTGPRAYNIPALPGQGGGGTATPISNWLPGICLMLRFSSSRANRVLLQSTPLGLVQTVEPSKALPQPGGFSSDLLRALFP